MKHCPKCQSTYTDDTLGFCLQDGTALFNSRDLLAGMETIQLKSDSGTQAMRSTAPTMQQTGFSGSNPSLGTGNMPAPKSNKAVVGGILIVVLLLVVLIGITTAVLLRGVLWDVRTPRVRGISNVASPAPGPSENFKVTASASSTRRSLNGNDYYASNAIDDDPSSAWIEGADGPGKGSWIQCTFDHEVTLATVTIDPGYFKSDEAWSKNNRLKAATFVFSDGSSRQFDFPDEMKPQVLQLGGVKTSSVKIVINDYYAGTTDFNDTAISELKFASQP